MYSGSMLVSNLHVKPGDCKFILYIDISIISLPGLFPISWYFDRNYVLAGRCSVSLYLSYLFRDCVASSCRNTLCLNRRINFKWISALFLNDSVNLVFADNATILNVPTRLSVRLCMKDYAFFLPNLKYLPSAIRQYWRL